MIHSRGANASDAEWSQLLQGIGGGFSAVALQVSPQSSVPHADVAMDPPSCSSLLKSEAPSVPLLVYPLVSIIRKSASNPLFTAGSIWTHLMPGKLAYYLPQLTDEESTTLFGSLYAVAVYPRGNHPR